jgi:hypothetical protein
MKRFFLLAVIGCGICRGQTADECKPSVLNIPEVKYPCVYPDGQVVMAPTLRSPIGSSAVITGKFTKAEAERIANGLR